MIPAWQIWMIIGIICIVIEIFDPAFFFLSLGAAAIITGLISLVIKTTTPLQIIIFAILSFLAFLSMRKLGKKILSVTDKDTNVFALKGKTGIVMKAIPEHGKGYVKIGGEEWSAIEKDNKAVEMNAKVKVIDIDGNKVIVEAITPESPLD
jgi:membrane protein implicated in regulation of membrane protease activity